jgi:hypothetical protein
MERRRRRHFVALGYEPHDRTHHILHFSVLALFCPIHNVPTAQFIHSFSHTPHVHVYCRTNYQSV